MNNTVDANFVIVDELLWNSDLNLKNNKIILTDRLTGDEVVLKNVQKIQIGEQIFVVEDLVEMLGDPTTPVLFSDGLGTMKVNSKDPTPNVLWDQIAQFLIAEDAIGPTNAARVFSILHTAIYDAYAAYSEVSIRVSVDLLNDNFEISNSGRNNNGPEDAMHFAAHTVLSTMFPDSSAVVDRVFEDRLGLSIDDMDGNAAIIGRDAAYDVLTPRLAEMAFLDSLSASLYSPQNSNDKNISNIVAWTPEGNENLQSILSPEFSLLEPFALPQLSDGSTNYEQFRPPPPEPFFTTTFADAQINIANKSFNLTRAVSIDGDLYPAGADIPVSRDLIGLAINPEFISQTEALIYASANLQPEQRVVAELWEDNLGTSFPPGAMMSLAQFTSERDGHDIASDAQLFLSMGNAMLDAAISTWDAKLFYDYARPFQVVRSLGELGLIGSPGIDEMTGEAGHVIEAFAGWDPDTGASLGTQTILALNFVTYQLTQLQGGSFSPPFPEYVSGHSGFSSAASSVLNAFTGSDYLGATLSIPAKSSDFDPTFPNTDLELYWETFSDLAQEAGMSRIYGGIHFDQGNEEGLILGTQIGTYSYELGVSFADGSATEQDQPFADWLIA